MNNEARIRTILIGCGRIGAGNGNRAHRLTSHAGVLSQMHAFEVFACDSDSRLARLASEALGVGVLEQLNLDSLAGFDCAVVCTPTDLHFAQLRLLMECKIPLIVCEKPLCSTLLEVSSLRDLRDCFKSRILVNYTRRFQPAYIHLKRTFSRLLKVQKLKCCSIRYQRGFLNNASHALDLVQFLTSWDIDTAQVNVLNSLCDEFPNDPTATCYGTWNEALLSIVGLPEVKYSFFEIDFFFNRSAIRLRDRGDTIEIASAGKPNEYYAPLTAKRVTNGSLTKPLRNLYSHVEHMIRAPEIEDNFNDSLELTSWILKTINGAG